MANPEPHVDIMKLKQYVNLYKIKKETQKKLAELQSLLDVMEKDLVEEFIEAGMQNVGIDDRLVYLNPRIYASTDDDEKLWRLLTELTDFDAPMKINRNTLSAWAGKLPRDEQTGEIVFPDNEIKDLLKVKQEIHLNVRNR